MTDQLSNNLLEDAAVLPGDGISFLLPSGREVRLMDVVLDVPSPLGRAVRFRFLSTELAQEKPEAAALFTDMEYLCNRYALAKSEEVSPDAEQIVISLSAAPIAFGQASDDIAQYFEAFSRQGQTCEWDAF